MWTWTWYKLGLIKLLHLIYWFLSHNRIVITLFLALHFACTLFLVFFWNFAVWGSLWACCLFQLFTVVSRSSCARRTNDIYQLCHWNNNRRFEHWTSKITQIEWWRKKTLHKFQTCKYTFCTLFRCHQNMVGWLVGFSFSCMPWKCVRVLFIQFDWTNFTSCSLSLSRSRAPAKLQIKMHSFYIRSFIGAVVELVVLLLLVLLRPWLLPLLCVFALKVDSKMLTFAM